jgi:hypothetical protein
MSGVVSRCSREFLIVCCIVLAILLLQPVTVASAASLDGETETPLDAPIALWKTGEYADVAERYMMSTNPMSFVIVQDLSEAPSSKIVVTSDSALSSLPDSDRESVVERYQEGTTFIALGGACNLPAILGRSETQPASQVIMEERRITFDISSSVIVEEQMVASEILPVESVLTYGISSGVNEPWGELLYESSETPEGMNEALTYALDWAAQGSTTLQSDDLATVDQLISAAVEEQMVEESELDVLLETDYYTGSDWVADINWVTEITRGPSLNEPTTLDAKMTLYWWKLTDIYADKDYYLVDVRTDTYISDFTCSADRIGYYLSHRFNYIDLDIYDDVFHTGHWLEYAPGCSTDDVVVDSYSIGASVNTASAGLDFGVSRSYTKPSVTVDVSLSSDDEWIQWDEQFRGPDLTWWPFVTEPALASHSGYYSYHSVIGTFTGGASALPGGMQTYVSNAYEVKNLHDFIAIPPLFIVIYTETTYTFHSAYKVECDLNKNLPALVSPLNAATSVATPTTLDWTNAPPGCQMWYCEDWTSSWHEGWYCDKSQKKIYPGIGATVYWRVYAQDPSTGIWSIPTSTWRFSTQTWLPCILEGTMITMEDGSTVAIEKLRAGMSVMAYDVDQGCLASAAVTAVDQHWTDSILTINHGRLSLTPYGHPVYARCEDFTGWVTNAIDLELGWELFEPMTAEWVEITHLHVSMGKYRVIDINVAYPDDFIANGILVHNKPIRG